MQIKSVGATGFRGLNNRLPSADLHVGEDDSDWLSRADNVDITNAGTIVRRDGYVKAMEGTACHSLWSNGQLAFVVSGSTLYRLHAAAHGLEKEAIKTDMLPMARVSFAELNGTVFFSDGHTIHRILGGVVQPVWAEEPNWRPAVEVGNTGGLPAALYQILLTQVNAAGEESPATFPVTVEIAGQSSLQQSLPASGAITITPAVAGHYRIYATPPNGDVFYKVGESAAGEAFTRSTPVDGGARCPTLNLKTFPPCEQLSAGANRLYGSVGNALYASEPFSPGLYNPVGGYALFPAPITVLAATSGGVYVVADQTYWLTLALDELREIQPFGAAFGSAINRNDADGVAWFSERGLLLGDNAGNTKLVQEPAVFTGGGEAAALVQRERNGMKTLTAVVENPSPTGGIRPNNAQNGCGTARACGWFELR